MSDWDTNKELRDNADVVALHFKNTISIIGIVAPAARPKARGYYRRLAPLGMERRAVVAPIEVDGAW